MSVPGNLEAQMVEKTTDQLLAMFQQPDNWLPETLDIAKAELRRRGVDAPVVRAAPIVRRCRGAFTLNGIGTTFYGQRDFRKDGSYTTTEWLVFFYVPLIPIRSLRVRYQGPAESSFPIGFGSAESYTIYEKRFPHWKQVLCTYGYISLVAAWAYLAGSALVSLFPHALESAFSITLVFIVCILPIPTPWILRHYALRNSRRA